MESIEVKVEEEDQAIFLLNSLPKAYDNLRDTLKYGKESLSLEEVISAAYSKELDLKANFKVSRSQAEGLTARGRPEKRNGQPDKHGKSRGVQDQNQEPRELVGAVIKKDISRNIVNKEEVMGRNLRQAMIQHTSQMVFLMLMFLQFQQMTLQMSGSWTQNVPST